ncbi:MAG: hypothetical protein M4D80_04785 [Myxococcota bacterium]|nr:hypothetical protein [Deltaproteobacteria bacterium]MDQ3334453.1 hypothetical protein [Myxococcota bacterium]
MTEPRKDSQVLFATDGVQLVRHADGSRELRLSNQALENLENAFDAIVTAIWLAPERH